MNSSSSTAARSAAVPRLASVFARYSPSGSTCPWWQGRLTGLRSSCRLRWLRDSYTRRSWRSRTLRGRREHECGNGLAGGKATLIGQRAARPSTDLQLGTFEQLSEDLSWTTSVEAYPSIEESEDIYGKVDTKLAMSLTEAMFASAQLVVDYDNTPAAGADRVDQRLVLSLGWSF